MQKIKKNSQEFFGIFIFGHFFCPFFGILKKSWEKKIKKNMKKIVTIKKIKVRRKNKNFQVCDAIFFS